MAKRLSEDELRAITDSEMRLAVGYPEPKAFLAKAQDVLAYDDENGVFTWSKARPRVHVGMVAGWNNGKGYRVIELFGKGYMAHRLAWLWAHGEWPTQEIDHINGNRDDNRIANLRVLSHAENCQNKRRARADSKSGVQGAMKRQNRYVAEIVSFGKRIYLGSYRTAEEAGQAYQVAKKAIHVEGVAA